MTYPVTIERTLNDFLSHIIMVCEDSISKWCIYAKIWKYHAYQHPRKPGYLHENIDQALPNKLDGQMHHKTGVTRVYNDHVFYTRKSFTNQQSV